MIKASQVKNIIFGTVRVAGPVAASITGIQAGIKAVRAIEQDQYKIEETDEETGETTTKMVSFIDLERGEQVRILAPILLPTIIATGGTIACSIIDKKCDAKHLKELNGLYTVALATVGAYRDKVKDIAPDDIPKIEDEIQETLKKIPEAKTSDHPWREEPEKSKWPGEDLFIDTLSGRQFWGNVKDVLMALRKTEDDYAQDDWIAELANENKINADDPSTWPPRCMGLYVLYKNLGIEDTFLGHSVGWYGYYNKDFGYWDGTERLHLSLTHGRNGAYYLDYSDLPSEGWDEN